MICDVDLDLPDGARTHTVEVARGFAAEGLRVELVTRGSDPELPGVLHHRARGSETGRMVRVFDLSLRSLGVLGRHRRDADRAYIRNKWSNVPIIFAARLLGYRVVTQVDPDLPFGRGHELPIPIVVDYVKRLSTILMGRLSHGIVTMTPETKALLVEEFWTPSERIAVVPNGVDVDFFHPLPRSEATARVGLDRDCRYTVFCGAFQPWVDFDAMLAAFAIVAAAVPDARLVLVGDGVERERIDAEILRLQIADAVVITGFQYERSAVKDFLATATVTLSAWTWTHRSRFGLSPVKLAEYMACGRAIVTTDLPGLTEMIEDTEVGVVTSADPQPLSGAIIALLEDPKRADELGANGRRKAEESYSWRSIVRRTLPLFGI
jgi:glycosyltransferase involved in cell wall biosynthesis